MVQCERTLQLKKNVYQGPRSSDMTASYLPPGLTYFLESLTKWSHKEESPSFVYCSLQVQL